VDLSAATVQDPNTVFNLGGSTLGTTSQVALTDGYAGSVESNSATRGVSEIPAFVFRISTSADVYKDFSGVVIRVIVDSWPTATTTRYWRLIIGVGDSNTNIVDDKAVAAIMYTNQTTVTGRTENGLCGNTFQNGSAPDDAAAWGAAKGGTLVTAIQWSDDSSGQTGPEARGVNTSSQRLDQSDGSIAAGAALNPPNAWAAGNLSIFVAWDINNTGTSARPDAGTFTNLELSYQLIPRPV